MRIGRGPAASGEPEGAFMQQRSPGSPPGGNTPFDVGSAGPRRLQTREVADHEVEVDQPERDPDGPDGPEPDGEEDEAGDEEKEGGAEEPAAVAPAGVPRALGLGETVARGSAVVAEGSEDEGEGGDAHHEQGGLEQEGVHLAAREARKHEEEDER